MVITTSRPLRLLFLAKYAPMKGTEHLEADPEDGILPRYHFELHNALSLLGLDVISSRNPDILLNSAPQVDYVFSIYNRLPFRDSEVYVSSICESLNLPYLGARPVIRALALDKQLAKIFAHWLDIPTPRWLTLQNYRYNKKSPFPGPFFVKPRYGAASEGINEASVVENLNELEVHLNEHTHFEPLIEEYIPGADVTVPVLGDEAPLVLPPMISKSAVKGGIQTFRQKRMLDGGLERSFYLGPALDSLKGYSLRLFKELAGLDYARFDFRLTETGEVYFLEFNVCCNLGSHSTIAKPAQEVGIAYKELVAHILRYSCQRQGLLRNCF